MLGPFAPARDAFAAEAVAVVEVGPLTVWLWIPHSGIYLRLQYLRPTLPLLLSVLGVTLVDTEYYQRKVRGRGAGRLVSEDTGGPPRCVECRDIPDIVELSFSTGVFTAAGKCRLQVEGTCIGNQISPIFPGLPVLMAERQFLLSLPTTLSSVIGTRTFCTFVHDLYKHD